MNVPNQIPLVDKMIVSDLRFPNVEVLDNKEAIMDRITKLHNATSLGNLSKHKVIITFEDTESIKQVHTTIWAITDKKILLKAGRSLPINRIHKVELT